MERGYNASRWLTFKQALDIGAHVRKGETGTPVVFFKPLEVAEKADTQTSVYPREVVKVALAANAGSAIFAHNHPSGVSEASASLDGITLEGDLLLEVKCPYKGKSSALWQSVAVGEVPEHYRIQVQHQLMVAGAKLVHLWVFDGAEGLLVEIKRDEAAVAAIREAWDGFQKYLDSDTPPPLTERDTVERNDPVWQLAAGLYVTAKRKADEAATELEKMRERLVALASHVSETGFGVSVTRYFKQGNVDYKKVPELKGVDLDNYRGAGREEVRVTVAK